MVWYFCYNTANYCGCIKNINDFLKLLYVKLYLESVDNQY